ncbi:hypothetical protein LYNGBM3L_00320 [Moorena producens 3L]|uniref:Uncharacterized protein n=1 Tax=Moorena producens 3L TaxID=489825 RepID=F4XI55_9CYAN|nr:hypothetical protein LYNGBM3L_00320 [Moorena producens 3L]
MLDYLSDCQLSPHRGFQLAWLVHVSQRQIKDFARGLIARQTPQKLTRRGSAGVVG